MSIAYRLVRSTITGVYNRFISTPPVLNTQHYFPEAHRFTSQWQVLREEAMQLIDNIESVPRFHELMPEQYQLSSHGNKEWRMFIVRAYGLDISENMTRVPVLANLVRSDPSIKSASISFLAPGKQVPTHTGPFRGITRFYMGLQVPLAQDGEPGVTLTIANQNFRLGNGDALLWDDTYPHSVANNTDQWRIALLLDIYRADMPGPLRAFTNSIIGLARLSIKWRGIFPDEFA
ncbi:MAG: aspartyl/asparaginyl beta-hydroxylase domain-containing protein [Pseudohongiellaceae bacterium]